MLFSEFAQINPKVDLKKGEFYPFIEMNDLTPGRRYISAIKEKVFKGGGSRFKTGDVIFARITPCLEHGKIAQIKGKDNEEYFGSTEFFVFRAKRNISDEGFLFYLSYSDILRKPAEKSMYGASGRQRASLDVVKAIEVPDVTLKDQQKISSILSAYDDLIENNTRRIKILEEMAQRIYQEWFVDFRFPGYKKVKFVDSELGKIPDGWEVVSLGDICYIEKNKYKDQEHSTLPLLDLARIPRKSLAINSLGSNCELKTSRIIFRKCSILFGSIRPYFHKVFYAFCDGITNTSVFVIKAVNSILVSFLFFLLFSESSVNWANQNSGGTKMPVISWDVFKNMKVILPDKDLLSKYDTIISNFLQEISILNLKNLKLKETRDLLLPKLISGELDVSDLDIAIRE